MQKLRFTETFERTLLRRLITKSSVFKKVEQIKPEFFEESALRHQICALIREYARRNGGSQPSFNYLGDKCLQLSSEISEDCLNELSEVEGIESDYTDSEFTELLNQFLISRQIQSTLLEAVDDLERGDYASIKTRIDTLYGKQSSVSKGGLNYFDISQRQLAALETPLRIPTPWPSVNHLMHGGLGYGELGMILGPSGTFKTQLLLHIMKGALVARCPVVYFSLEVAEHILANRIDSMFTGQPMEVVREFPEDVEHRVKKIFHMLKTPLMLKQYPMRMASVSDLRAFVSDWQQAIGERVGMVIIDYPDLLAFPKDLPRNTFPTTEIFTQIRRWAVEDAIVTWVASQTTRASANKALIRKDDVADDTQKINISDVAITINMTEDEYSQRSVRLFFAKTRNSEPYIQVPLTFSKPGFNFREDS